MKQFKVTVNGNAYDVTVQEMGSPSPVAAASAPLSVSAAAPAPAAAPVPATAPAPAPSGAVGSIKVNSPMPGNILDVKVDVGQSVVRGDVLVILEAMKMENEIVAPGNGTVANIHVRKGESVDTGALLVSLH